MFRSRATSYFLGFGIILTMLSIPILMGLARPFFDMHNPYTLIYGLIDLPVTLVFQGVATSLAESVWDSPTMEQADLVLVIISVVFWSLVGVAVGKYADMKYGSKS